MCPAEGGDRAAGFGSCRILLGEQASERVVVVQALRLAEALGERLRRETRLVALAAELLDRDVARGVDLGARDDPRRAVLVPHPDVLHLRVEERVARLRHDLEVELVAEVRRILREHAVPEQREDRRVLALQLELELRLELVELVEMAHAVESSPGSPGRGGRGAAAAHVLGVLLGRPGYPELASRASSSVCTVSVRPGTTRSGASSASGSRAKRRSWRRGCGTVRPGSSTTSPSWTRRSRSIVRGPHRSPVRSRPSACSTERRTVEQRPRLEAGLELDDTVQVPRLLDRAPRVRLAEQRDRRDLDARSCSEQVDRPSDRCLPVAEVRSDADVRAHDRDGSDRARGCNVGLTAVLNFSSSRAATHGSSPHAPPPPRSPRRCHGARRRSELCLGRRRGRRRSFG